jgi:F0F1-type ATP synthase assembly protein I
VPSDFDSQEIKTETQLHRIEHEIAVEEEEAKQKLEKGKEIASKKAKEAKKRAKNAAQTLKENSDNPVFIANGVAFIALGGFLGYTGYKKYAANELSWEIVGAATAGVAVLAVGDYYLSQYLFQKYPKK